MPALAVIFLATVGPAGAQDKKKDAELRTVHGTVIDGEQNPVATSVIYLKNVRTQAIKTHIADDAGTYRFSGLDPNVDYEIHAERGELMSPVKTITSFDNRKDIEINLKLNRKRPS
jgi:hypothetical protein